MAGEAVGEHPRAARHRELDREVADAAGAAAEKTVSPPRSPSVSSPWWAVSAASGSAAASSERQPSGMCAR